jgi:hypothetical protein
MFFLSLVWQIAFFLSNWWSRYDVSWNMCSFLFVWQLPFVSESLSLLSLCMITPRPYIPQLFPFLLQRHPNMALEFNPLVRMWFCVNVGVICHFPFACQLHHSCFW